MSVFVEAHPMVLCARSSRVQASVSTTSNYPGNNMHHGTIPRPVTRSDSFGLHHFRCSIEDSFKQRFMNSINQAEIPIFTEDLRNMILAAETDEDVDAVIQALKK